MKRLILKAQKKKKKIKNNNHINIDKDTDTDTDSDSNISLSDNEHLLELKNMLLNNRYVFISYLSKGTFSEVWIVYDLATFDFKTAKVYYDSEKYYEFENEIKIIKMINKNSHIVQTFDNFTHNTYKIIIMELLGISLLDVINDIYDSKININIVNVKEMYRQILKAYSELHSFNIIHSDIKPDNILFDIYPNYIEHLIIYVSNLDIQEVYNNFSNKLIPSDFDDFHKNKKKNIKKKVKIKALKATKDYLCEKLLFIDNSKYDKTYNKERITSNNFIIKIIDFSNSELETNISQSQIYSRPYRSLENIINLNYNIKSDIWAIGCLFYEIITGELLFKINYNTKLNKDIDHIYNIYKTFEEDQNEFIKVIEKCDYYDTYFINNKLIIETEYDILNLKSKLLNYSIVENNLSETLSFLKLFFLYNTDFRPDTDILLEHKYLYY